MKNKFIKLKGIVLAVFMSLTVTACGNKVESPANTEVTDSDNVAVSNGKYITSSDTAQYTKDEFEIYSEENSNRIK